MIYSVKGLIEVKVNYVPSIYLFSPLNDELDKHKRKNILTT